MSLCKDVGPAYEASIKAQPISLGESRPVWPESFVLSSTVFLFVLETHL